MLIALLFQLGVEQRAGELGTLAAVGVGRERITRLLAREGTDRRGGRGDGRRGRRRAATPG